MRKNSISLTTPYLREYCLLESSLLSVLNESYYGSEELFYQLALRQFGSMKPLKLNPPPSIKSLIRIAIDVEDTASSSVTKDQLVEVCFCRCLCSQTRLTPRDIDGA
jgi:DNA mismatch repair protein MLH1